MKLEPRRVAAFLRDPGQARAVLLHGEDAGLIAERAGQLVRVVAGSLDDPFRVVELPREAATRIPEEMQAVPLTGGRRVVRLREATDACTPAVERALAAEGPGFLVLEGFGVPARSRLRTLVEGTAGAVAIGCYPSEGEGLGREIRDGLQARDVGIEAGALAWLQGRGGGDWAFTRADIEKLALFVGAGGTASLSDVEACVGDAAASSLDDALFAATAGDAARADLALGLALAEGTAPVAVLRAALGHVQRLLKARSAVAGGASPGEAVRGLRPPVFFRREPDFVRAVRSWSEAGLARAASELWRQENACKRTGAPAETICRQAILALARRGARG